MADENGAWARQGEAFWRAHHEAWKRSDLNQRQYCEAEDIPLKAFGTAGDLQTPAAAAPTQTALAAPGLSPPFSPQLSPPFSPPLNPGVYPSSRSANRIVARPREGHRRRFSEADKRQILAQAALDGTSAAEVARRYGIDGRVLRRWKQELAPPAFAAVKITDAETVA